MAFDGITVRALKNELNTALSELYVSRISQPEKDEILLTLKGRGTQTRLLLSASPSYPLVYLCDKNRPGPAAAPNFCMVLRKHLSNARFLSVAQPGLERILRLEFEHADDLGDRKKKVLVAELMGKHSNLILLNDREEIIDSIRHISHLQSSLREVLPQKPYFVPTQSDRSDPLSADPASLIRTLKAQNMPSQKALYSAYTGISPSFASELFYRAGIDGDLPFSALSAEEQEAFARVFVNAFQEIVAGAFHPCIYYEDQEPVEFSCLPYQKYPALRMETFPTVSEMLLQYYGTKQQFSRIRQRSSDLRRVVQTHLERSSKKWDLQRKQLSDCGKMEKYRLWGELLKAYFYQIPDGAKSYDAYDWNTDQTVTVPMDPEKTAAENSQNYFSRYAKLKRTKEALSEEVKKTEQENLHLQSILTSLSLSETEADLTLIREEMTEAGFLKKRALQKKPQQKSRPLHFKSSDGFDLYVGKNNYQNDALTFQFAKGNDWWFHAKKMPGSHVILVTDGKELPDRAFEEAAALAAWYSDGRDSEKTEVDYVLRKEVKKPKGAAPGFVVYYTNYSVTITPGIDTLTPVIE